MKRQELFIILTLAVLCIHNVFASPRYVDPESMSDEDDEPIVQITNVREESIFLPVKSKRPAAISPKKKAKITRFSVIDNESKKVQDQEAGIKETIPTPMSIFSLSRRPSQVQPALTPVDRRVPPPAPLSPVTPLVDQRVPPPAPRKSGRAVIVQVNGGNMVSRRLFDDDERFSGAV